MREKIINLFFVLFVFLLGAGSMYLVNDSLFTNESTTIKEVNKVTENRNITITDNDISEAVANVYDAVVMIKNYQKNKYAGSGSGFVYKTDNKYAYILTNYHVVEGASKLLVLYANDTEVTAEYLSGDQYLDIAVIRVAKESILKVATLGKSKDLSLGDTIFAVGSPVGEEYYNTITRGIVSGLNRKITVSVQSNNDWVMKAIQVDAAINPGNSGGPLVNGKGEVVGINSMKLVDSSVEGMGFSIMIEDALAYTDLFEQGKEIERPLLGITFVNVGEDRTLQRYDIELDDNITYGVVVISVADGSGAAQSELRKGDVIIKIGDEKVDNFAYLRYVLYSYSVGDTIDVTYIREGKEYTTKVTLTKNDG
jgi:serine protease Do